MLDKVSEYTSATSQNLMAVGKKKTKKNKECCCCVFVDLWQFFPCQIFSYALMMSFQKFITVNVNRGA